MNSAGGTVAENDGGTDVPSYAWKSAYGVLGATLLAVALGIGFFAYGGVFAPLSDAAALLVAGLLAPVIWSLHRLNRDDAGSRIVLWVGVAAAVATAIGSVGLLLKDVFVPGLAGTVGAGSLGVQFLGWILLGAWLLGIGIVGLRTGSIRRRTSWAGIVAGIGSAGGVLTLTYSYWIDSFSPLFPLAWLLYTGGFVLWAIWLGGELRHRTPEVPGETTGEREVRS